MADRSDNRVLNEHREVCAFLLHMLLEAGQPREGAGPFTWVDLGCGAARILHAVREGVAHDLRRQLSYTGYDKADAAGATDRLKGAGLHDRSAVVTGFDVERQLGDVAAGCAELVTLTNVVHEIDPARLPAVLLGAVWLLKPKGYLLVYDVERLADQDAWGDPGKATGEWDAVTWSRDRITNVVAALLQALGAATGPVVGRWIHQQTTGWTAVVRRADLHVTADAAARAARDVHQAVSVALAGQFADCRAYIEAIMRDIEGLASADDEHRRNVVLGRVRRDLPHQLRNYHAMSRHLGGSEANAVAFRLPAGVRAPAAAPATGR